MTQWVDRDTQGSDDSSAQGSDEHGNAERKIHHQKIEPDVEDAEMSLLRLIANFESCEVTDLPPLHNTIDDMVDQLFTNPPSAKSQAELAFSYATRHEAHCTEFARAVLERAERDGLFEKAGPTKQEFIDYQESGLIERDFRELF